MFGTLFDDESGTSSGLSEDEYNRQMEAWHSSTEDDIHIESAVLKGYVEERRAKYLDRASGQWTSTFVGAFRINPPESTEVPNFDRIVPFEFFLWSDVDPQPNFDYVKKTIAAAVEVKRSQFFFETMSGKKLEAQSIMAEEHESLIAAGEASELLNGKHLIDIRIFAKVREPMPAPLSSSQQSEDRSTIGAYGAPLLLNSPSGAVLVKWGEKAASAEATDSKGFYL